MSRPMILIASAVCSGAGTGGDFPVVAAKRGSSKTVGDLGAILVHDHPAA